jgi:hypothetical protein
VSRAAPIGAVAALLLLFANVGPASAAIRVDGQNGTHYMKVKSLKCKVAKNGFTAQSKDLHGWSFRVRVYGQSFKGFGKEYEIEYGDDSRTDFFAYHTGTSPLLEGNFTNVHDPTEGMQGPQLIEGGSLAFKKKGKTLGIAFPIVYDRPDSEAGYASVIGEADCKY